MAKYIENIVIGDPICDLSELFALNKEDWLNNEQDKTMFTTETYLPKIMVESGVVKSISEVKRNKPQYNITLNKQDFIEIKWGKRKLWICVGLM